MIPAVLVAGGAGYIGAQTCKTLSQNGFLPVTIDNLSTGHRQAVRWGPLIEADIRDRNAVLKAIADHHIGVAIHFAAFSLVGESMREPEKYFDNNVAAATAFAEHLSAGGVKALVFSSTAAVYGVPQTSLIGEDHPKQPINPYGESKLAFEQTLQRMTQTHGLSHVSLRYFNAAGADPEGETGESHRCETHLIPLACQSALGVGKPLTVFGDDYATADGTAVRDYVHVVDLAEAHLAAIRYLQDGGSSDAFNVGTGAGLSVREIIRTTEAALGLPVPHSIGPRREGDPDTLVADVAKIHARLGWRARQSDADTLIRSAAQWQKTRPY